MLTDTIRRRWAAALLTVTAMFLAACGSTTSSSVAGSDDGLQRAEVPAEALSFADAQTIDAKSFDSASADERRDGAVVLGSLVHGVPRRGSRRRPRG